MRKFFKVASTFFLVVATLSIVSCTSNKPYRTVIEKKSCESNSCEKKSYEKKLCKNNSCEKKLIEKHKHYDLAFIEFTDGGNLFSRDKYNKVLKHIRSKKKIKLMVYVHGWTKNASNVADGDVRKFRELLQTASKESKERVVGVYIGWRGLSINLPIAMYLTFWGRKNTAHRIGSGGLTEVLVQLDTITRSKNKSLAVIGHSMGAAAILSAMKEILIQKLITKKMVSRSKQKHIFPECKGKLKKTDFFGDGIYLLNPAVEANELLQIKEIINEESCYSPDQTKLLHIVTSEEDIATKVFFFIGQKFVSIYRNEKTLDRQYTRHSDGRKKSWKVSEEEFSGLTIANAPHFITHRIIEKNCAGKNDGSVCVVACKDNAGITEDKPKYIEGCVRKDDLEYNIPVPPYSPLSIISVEKGFIRNHNDIFNARVLSYISAGVESNRIKKHHKYSPPKKCMSNNSFSFSKCVIHYRKKFVKMGSEQSSIPKTTTKKRRCSRIAVF